jgi:hypothetical protein
MRDISWLMSAENAKVSSDAMVSDEWLRANSVSKGEIERGENQRNSSSR